MHAAKVTFDERSELLERSRELSTLGEWLSAVVSSSHGRLVLVAGEAGVGKTALLRRLREEHGDGPRFLWGACEALFTPRPLGPLLDIAELTGGELAEVVAAGAKPHDVVGALIRELGSASADGARARGPALGGRGDARRAQAARPPDRERSRAWRSPATETTSSTAGIRSGSCSESSAAARRSAA